MDIYSRLFSSLDYIRTFIQIVRFQHIYSNVLIKQNKTCYATKDLYFKNSTLYINKISPYFVFKVIHTFICEYNKWTNIFRYSFMKFFYHQIYLDIYLWEIHTLKCIWLFIHQRKMAFVTHWHGVQCALNKPFEGSWWSSFIVMIF